MRLYPANLLPAILILLLAGSCSQSNSANSPGGKASPVSNTEDLVAESASEEPTQEPETVLSALRDRAEDLQLCEGETSPETWKQSQVYQTGEGTYLVEVLCFMAAYQGNYEYWLYRTNPTGAEVTPLNLTIFEETESGELVQQSVPSVGGLPDYDPKQQRLTLFTKYRGLGDCGALAQYQFTDQAFQLLEYRAKSDCDGNYVDPEKYPLIFPAG